MSQAKPKTQNRLGWLIGGGVLVLGAAAAFFLAPQWLGANTAAAEVVTAEVTAITSISRVEASGTVAARQSGSLAWKTTGQVAEVLVKVGDRVEAGQPLMTLDPLSAPANVISAQADLINAQNALEDLLQPAATDIANAQKAVADAQETLAKAERTLRNTKKPNVAYYEDQYNRAQQTLTAAEQNAEITNFATTLTNAQDALETATSNLAYYQNLEALYPGYSQQHGNILEKMQTSYDKAVVDVTTAQYNLDQAQARNGNSVADAQDSLTTARANLAAAKAGPDALDLAQAEADVTVAQARLAEAQDRLATLLTGAEADDLAAARARVQSAQATVDQLTLKAPFAGEVLAVNDLPGDLVSQAQVAVVLADRTALHVDVQVDETEVARIQIGDAVTITLDALAAEAFAGEVAAIDPVGQTLAGLVKYTVRVAFAPGAALPAFLGGTANVTIVTDVQADVLAVPLDAVQNDAEGEYVTRLNADGTRSRVAIRSGAIEGDLVTVSGGALVKGDRVELAAAPVTSVPTGPFGGRD